MEQKLPNLSWSWRPSFMALFHGGTVLQEGKTAASTPLSSHMILVQPRWQRPGLLGRGGSWGHPMAYLGYCGAQFGNQRYRVYSLDLFSYGGWDRACHCHHTPSLPSMHVYLISISAVEPINGGRSGAGSGDTIHPHPHFQSGCFQNVLKSLQELHICWIHSFHHGF